MPVGVDHQGERTLERVLEKSAHAFRTIPEHGPVRFQAGLVLCGSDNRVLRSGRITGKAPAGCAG